MKYESAHSTEFESVQMARPHAVPFRYCRVYRSRGRHCARVVSKVTRAGDGRSAALAGSSLTGAGGVAAPGAGACTNTVATAPVALAEPPSSTSLTMSTSAVFLSTNENNFVNLVTDLDPSKASLH